jgi:hypothetical protein
MDRKTIRSGETAADSGESPSLSWIDVGAESSNQI